MNNDSWPFTVRRHQEVYLVTLIDPPPGSFEVWKLFRKELQDFLETNQPEKLLVDFRHSTTFISSAMNWVFVTAKRQSDAWDCRWSLCTEERHEQFYRISYMGLFFPLRRTTFEEALELLD